MRWANILRFFVASLFAQVAQASGIDYNSAWHCDGTARFSWYCDEAPPAKAAEEAGVRQKPLTREEEAIERLAAWRKELEGKRALSIIEKTPESVKAYIEAQERMMQNSSEYSDVWRRVIWQNPDLNYELKRPANNAAIDSYNTARTAVERKTLDAINKEWGIFFFFRSDCQYCHRMAGTLKYLSEQYGIAVFPISGDGGGIKEYPKPQRDNGLADMLGIKAVPTLVLGNVKNRQMIPLASGLVSAQDVIERIYILTSTRPGELY
jgi:conjugal transfer pilus assembly protein TraF